MRMLDTFDSTGARDLAEQRQTAALGVGSSLGGVLLLGLGALGLGLVGLAVGDFGLQWQPVPTGLPAREPVAYATSALLVATAIAVLWTRSRKLGVALLALTYLAWVVLLHLPRVVVRPTNVATWLGFCEILFVACGALLLATSSMRPDRWTSFNRATQAVMGSCALLFGLSHFVYPDVTASLVPAWLPWPAFWALFTGAAHVAAGLALISGLLARPAALAFAAMALSFVLLVHLPRVVANPTAHAEWVMLFVAISIAGAGVAAAQAAYQLTPPKRG